MQTMQHAVAGITSRRSSSLSYHTYFQNHKTIFFYSKRPNTTRVHENEKAL